MNWNNNLGVWRYHRFGKVFGPQFCAFVNFVFAGSMSLKYWLETIQTQYILKCLAFIVMVLNLGFCFCAGEQNTANCNPITLEKRRICTSVCSRRHVKGNCDASEQKRWGDWREKPPSPQSLLVFPANVLLFAHNAIFFVPPPTIWTRETSYFLLRLTNLWHSDSGSN